jgi:hypothetical protein
LPGFNIAGNLFQKKKKHSWKLLKKKKKNIAGNDSQVRPPPNKDATMTWRPAGPVDGQRQRADCRSKKEHKRPKTPTDSPPTHHMSRSDWTNSLPSHSWRPLLNTRSPPLLSLLVSISFSNFTHSQREREREREREGLLREPEKRYGR